MTGVLLVLGNAEDVRSVLVRDVARNGRLVRAEDARFHLRLLVLFGELSSCRGI